MDYKFQINLRGLIDLLSNNLYSGEDVVARELLQNAVDAITARRALESGHAGTISIELTPAADGVPATLAFQDNGIGLTENEIHAFLATICQSSKRDEMFQRTGDFIGQFGIGILSCFVISDEITIVTRSAKAQSKAYEWRGRADGTYTIKTLTRGLSIGTRVYLRCKEGAEEFFSAGRIQELVLQFGGLLPFPIFFGAGDDAIHINAQPPPWRAKFSSAGEREEALRAYCRALFGFDYFDAIPLRSSVGDVDGVAFVLPSKPSLSTRGAHRVYLRNMLLSQKDEDLLPEWAFFVKCVVNTNDLRPTASRESFYHDKNLEAARRGLGQCLRRYLVQLAEKEPARMQRLISLHYLSMKALAVDDDEFCRMFIDNLPFETTLGPMTLLDCRERADTLRYVSSIDTFRQIAPIAAAQDLCVINAGYTYDIELIEKVPTLFPDMDVQQVEVSELVDRFTALKPKEDEQCVEFQALAARVLRTFDCACSIRKFKPGDLPALYIPSDDEALRKFTDRAKDVSNELFSGVIDDAVHPERFSSSTLCLNFLNPLIQHAITMRPAAALERMVRILYVQALLLGHHPLSAGELRVLNTDLLAVVETALADSKRSKRERRQAEG